MREAAPADREAIAVARGFYTAYAAAGTSIVCVRHPLTVARLKAAPEG